MSLLRYSSSESLRGRPLKRHYSVTSEEEEEEREAEGEGYWSRSESTTLSTWVVVV